MKTFAAVVLWTLATLLGHSEPRWCAPSARDSSNTLVYPPIAQAARVQGVVVMRMIYAPNGKVIRTEPVFGPVLLSNGLGSQLLNWTVKTEAPGEGQCVTLVIAGFRFHDAGEPPSRALSAEPSGSGILRLSVELEVVVMQDPGEFMTPVITRNPFRTFAHRVRRLTHHSVP